MQWDCLASLLGLQLWCYGTGPDSCPVVFIREKEERYGYREGERKVRWVACEGRKKRYEMGRALPCTTWIRLRRVKDRTQGSWMAHMNGFNQEKTDASRPKAITVVTTTGRYDGLRELLHLPHDNCYFRKLRMSFGETWEMTSWSFFFPSEITPAGRSRRELGKNGRGLGRGGDAAGVQ